MPTLVGPTESVHRSFLAAMAEFQAEGRGRPDDATSLGEELRRYGTQWTDVTGFHRFVAELLAQVREEAPRPDGWVPTTYLWWVDGPEYLGRLAVRHRLTPVLRELGGHIGYDVRPTARRRGHATAMLRAALPIAHRLGIDPALIMCDVTNVASRLVIERNGGKPAGQHGDKLHFWLPTG
ncbi:GNAT family N-acetyltransferase [Plantactinospora sp. GCM10030261]|uniref:GNAT family N-acetyltransferase n=1 Tax=Plantactinospora sp. GCM10030261 TaxID=3273420 RepID=UPI00360F6784